MLFMILSTDLVYEEQECLVKSGKDSHKDGLKKYPWILGNVSKDKSQSIQGYLTKYHGFISSPFLLNKLRLFGNYVCIAYLLRFLSSPKCLV